MNTSILTSEWLKQLPKIQCRRCKLGLFIFNKKNLIELEDGVSTEAKLLELAPSYYTGKFTVMANCTNPECKETSILSGKTKLEYDGWHDGGYDSEEGIEIPPHEQFGMRYNIQYLDPIFQIIETPEKMPNLLFKILDDSFKLFWVDKNACGNKVRSFIETLLDHLKVRRTWVKNGKRVKYTLHARIGKLKLNNMKLADNLLAIKWIGNSSSHSAKKIPTNSIIEAYKILEFSLRKIFGNEEVDIERLTKKINKRKS